MPLFPFFLSSSNCVLQLRVLRVFLILSEYSLSLSKNVYPWGPTCLGHCHCYINVLSLRYSIHPQSLQWVPFPLCNLLLTPRWRAEALRCLHAGPFPECSLHLGKACLSSSNSETNRGNLHVCPIPICMFHAGSSQRLTELLDGLTPVCVARSSETG